MKLVALLSAVLLTVGCAGPGPSAAPSPDGETLRVVATTTVFADLVTQVGGDRVTVHSLVPKGGEVHTFDPAPSDVAALSNTRLLVLNGLGLDEWLLDFAQEAGAGDVPVLELGEDLDGVEYIEGHDDHGTEDDDNAREDRHEVNPHLWLNAAYAKMYIERIRDSLIGLDPAGEATYRANADAYLVRLDELDDYARETLAAVAGDRRRIVSFHDAFPYFAQAYDLEIVGVVVDAPGQEPSAGEVAALIDAIRGSGASAILSETQFPDDLAQTIANETGVEVVMELYTDSLGDPPVDSYLGAMRWNIEQISGALE